MNVSIRYKNAPGEMAWQRIELAIAQPAQVGDYVSLAADEWRRIVGIRHLKHGVTEVYAVLSEGAPQFLGRP